VYPQQPPPDQPMNAPITSSLVSPAGYPMPPVVSPYPPARSMRTVVLAGVVGVLLIALAGTAIATLVTNNSVHQQMSTLDGDIAARNAARAQQRSQLVSQFQQSHLSDKLLKVRTQTDVARQALLSWFSRGAPPDGIKAVQLERNACEAAVIDYDATAAQFPPDLLAGLPLRIDMTDTTTNCDRTA
jgi:hypothetical protein